MPRLSVPGATRVFSKWRYLPAFWLALLVTVIAGGVVLQLLGPPSNHVNRDRRPSSPRASAAPLKPQPVTSAAAHPRTHQPAILPAPTFAASVTPPRVGPASLGPLARTPPAVWPTQPASLDVAFAASAPWLARSEADQHPARLPPAALARKPPALWPAQPAPLDVAITASPPAPVRSVVQPTPLPSHARVVGSADREGTQPPNQVLVTLHPAGSEDTKALAERLAARLGLVSDQITTGAAGGSRSGVVIRFYSAGDHTMARRIGNELTGMGYSWRIENLSNRPPLKPHQALEVWLTGR